MLTLDEWRRYTRGSTLGHSDEEIEQIAKACYDAHERGETTCIWHEASRLHKTLCYCANCRGKVVPS